MKRRVSILVLTAMMWAIPALAQTGGRPGMDHSKTGGMDYYKMTDDSGNPYGPDEMGIHIKMMAAKKGDAIAVARIAQREAQDADARQIAAMTITE